VAVSVDHDVQSTAVVDWHRHSNAEGVASRTLPEL
jgi:hypothetical protein